MHFLVISGIFVVTIPHRSDVGVHNVQCFVFQGFVVAWAGSKKNACVRLIKHFSKIKEEDWKKEVELAKELRQGLEHPNIIKYCWHSAST